MWEHLILIGSVLVGSVGSALQKVYQEKFSQNVKPTLLFTALVTFTIGIICIFFTGFTFSLKWQGWLFASIMGLMFTVNTPLVHKAIALGGMGFGGLFQLLGGMLLPFLYGILWLNESVLIKQIFGTLLIVIVFFVQIDFKKPSDKKFFIYAILTFLINGLYSVLLKVHSGLGSNTFEVMTVIGFVGGISSLITFIALNKKDKIFQTKKELIIGLGTSVGHGLMQCVTIGVKIFLGTAMAATFLFPFSTVISILFGILLGIILFKEKLNVRKVITIFISVLAVLCFTL